jgi:UDP-glucose 4-epimerase
MILFDWSLPEPGAASRRIVLLFGSGLIGSAILVALMSRAASAHRTDLAFDWEDTSLRSAQADSILRSVDELVGRAKGGGAVSIVWAAGKTGFASPPADLAVETRAFERVVDLAARLKEVTDAPSFHFLSSAGGLFEGQTEIDGTSTPAPLRPYGVAKLEQEQRLRDLPEGTTTLIYRPMSVYGYAGTRYRKGLVGTLIHDVINQQTTRIVGRPDTMRDYVLVDDVAEFIAEEIIAPRSAAAPLLLATGKPTAIAELVEVVQAILQRQLSLEYEARATNALDISVRPGSMPESWRATPLAVGIDRTAARIMAVHPVPAVDAG